MNQNLKEGSYYVLENYSKYILNRLVSIDVKYAKQGNWITYRRIQTEIFAEYKRIEEPMLFNYQGYERFSNIPFESPIYYDRCKLLENHTADNEYFDDSYKRDRSFNLKDYQNPGTILVDRIFYYPIYAGMGLNCRAVNGTELKNLVISASDTPYAQTTDGLTFKRHVDTLNSLFENACQVGGFPYKTVNEYNNFIARRNSIKQQQEIDVQRKNQQDGEAAIRILDRYKQ